MPQLTLTNSEGKSVQAKWVQLALDDQSPKLIDNHYMIQEIMQTPAVMRTLAKQSQTKCQLVAGLIKQAKKVLVIGSGSTGLAASSIAVYLRQIGQVGALALIGAEASSYLPFVDKHTLIISPSQSGETADVLEVLLVAKSQGAKIITFVNITGGTMTRLANVS